MRYLALVKPRPAKSLPNVHLVVGRSAGTVEDFPRCHLLAVLVEADEVADTTLRRLIDALDQHRRVYPCVGLAVASRDAGDPVVPVVDVEIEGAAGAPEEILSGLHHDHIVSLWRSFHAAGFLEADRGGDGKAILPQMQRLGTLNLNAAIRPIQGEHRGSSRIREPGDARVSLDPPGVLRSGRVRHTLSIHLIKPVMNEGALGCRDAGRLGTGQEGYR